ncbi:MAG: Na/Pi symporter [Oceanicoccus sp.]
MLSIVWELVIGLGVFLYGMSHLEEGIAALSSSRLKARLARSTASPVSSAGFGAVITTVLQSSSMVSLLVLAFASAGIMPLYNAIGVLIGANLGTTITGWIVATLGFKLDIATLALPLLGIGGFVQVMNSSSSRLYAWGQSATGLGLLLFGLGLMKDAVGGLPQQWDISLLQGYHPLIYLLAGLIATALIQSSSAVVMLTLTAINAGFIGLPEAGALVIGADLGTTGTTMLASLTGPGIKRQLALAQVVFNVIVDTLAFLFLLPLLPWIVQSLGISDLLYSVVAFHTTINLLGLLLFLPLLKPFSHWIEGFFQTPQDSLTLLLQMETPVPEAVLPAIEKALQQLWIVAAFNTLHVLGIKHTRLPLDANSQQSLVAHNTAIMNDSSPQHIYRELKHQEGILFQLSYKLQQVRLNEPQSMLLGKMQELARAIVYASKTIQDIAADIEKLRHSQNNSNSAASWLLTQQQQFLIDIYCGLLPLLFNQSDPNYLQEQLKKMATQNDLHFQEMNAGVYQRAIITDHSEPGLSIQLNVNREIGHAVRSLLSSIELWQDIKSPKT